MKNLKYFIYIICTVCLLLYIFLRIYHLDTIDKKSIQTTISEDLVIEEKDTIKKLFKAEDEINYQDYKLKIVTICQEDSVIPEEPHYFNPIVLIQYFIFYHNNNIIKSEVLPIRTVKQAVYGGCKQELKDCVFFNIKLIERKDKSLIYHARGYGGCNGDKCPGCDVIWSLDGNLIAFIYHSGAEGIIEKKGNISYLEELWKGGIVGTILKEITFYPRMR